MDRELRAQSGRFGAMIRHRLKMENWEFLLQKDGDRTWLPLESPDAEILEGRYRIVARSQRLNTNVEIRIVHESTEEVPPKRRVQMRSSRTNHEGLMVVIPFTHLKAGTWQFSCFGDVMSDLMGDPWKSSVQLQVVPQDAEVEEWEPNWQSPHLEPEAMDADATSREVVDFQDDRETAISLSGANLEVNEARTVGVGAATEFTMASDDAIVEDVPSPNDLPIDERLPETTAAESTDGLNELFALTSTNGSAASLDPEVSQVLGTSMEHFLEVAEQLSQQLVDQVLQEFDLASEFDSDLETNSKADAATPHLAEAPDSVQPTEIRMDFLPLTHANADVSIPQGMDLESGLFAAETNSEEANPPVSPELDALTAIPSFSLTLDQEAYIARRGQFVILKGQVGTIDPSEPAVQELTGELQICLRDPQSSQVLAQSTHTLPKQALPFSFTYPIEIPNTLETRLILGEVALHQVEDKQNALATQPFMVTIDVDELLGELARLNQAMVETEPEDWLEVGAKPADLMVREQLETTYLKLSFLSSELEAEEKAAPLLPPPFQSLAGQPLPPQLYRPDPTQSGQRSLDLPQFVKPSTPVQAESEPESEPEPIAAEALSEEPPSGIDAELEQVLEEFTIVAPDESTLAAEAQIDLLSSALDTDEARVEVAELDAFSDPESIAEEMEEVEPDDRYAPEVVAFQSLKLQDRFWARLNSLATDTELSNWLKLNLPNSDPPPVMELVVHPAPSRTDANDPSAQEIVVDDEPVLQPVRAQNGRQVANSTTDTAVLPENEPVPTPTLEVTSGELVAGETVTLRVRMPQFSQRIYVKVWVNDCQTRTLLDGPRWLVDFLPNGFGQLEAPLQLTVPFGSLEIRFEAIAVEMQTQRESHKVSVTRRVIPPDTPDFSLDEFDA
jgi:hypothetical protein